MLAQARPPMINHLTGILCCFVSILLGVSVALMLALCTLSCCCLSVQMFQKLSCLPYVLGSVLTCVQFVQVFQKLSCLPYVFGSVLACAKSAHVSQNLLLALQTLPICFVTNNSSSDSNTYVHFIAFSGSPMALQRASFSSIRSHDHSHKLTSSHTLRYYTVCIPISDA